jgi:vacuolar-type H+-ATPase subunit H
MKHTMSVKKIRNMGQRLTKQAAKVWTVTAAQEPPETAVDKALRMAREKLDKAEIKFHEDSLDHLKKAKQALSLVQAHYSRAYVKHEKATKD